MKPTKGDKMRLPILLFAGAALVATGWRVGTWCGNALTDNLDAYCEKWAANRQKEMEAKGFDK